MPHWFLSIFETFIFDISPWFEGVPVRLARARLPSSPRNETLGHIGQIVFPKENGNILYFDAQINEEAQTNSASAQILKDIGNMLHKEIVRTH